MKIINIKWIAVDWGSTNLRAWAMDEQGKVIDQRQSNDGASQLSPSEFETVLIELVSDWLEVNTLPVFICGMAGSAQGWLHAPYLHTPCKVSGLIPVRVPSKDVRINAHILPGLCQTEPVDVMRGEETQITGFLAKEPDFEGCICLPGTHSKWVQIREHRVESFRTAMTGELFSLLSTSSVLKHSIPQNFSDLDNTWCEESFLKGVQEGLQSPEKISSSLFGIRALSLLKQNEKTSMRDYLSGMLIGLELAGNQSLWQQRTVVLIGEQALCQRYQCALDQQHCNSQVVNSNQMTVTGLHTVYKHSLGEDL